MCVLLRLGWFRLFETVGRVSSKLRMFGIFKVRFHILSKLRLLGIFKVRLRIPSEVRTLSRLRGGYKVEFLYFRSSFAFY